jgi:hypothetical protein
MATSRSRGTAGSRSGRARPSGDDFYNDESPEVILPNLPRGRAGSGGAKRGSGSSSSGGSGRNGGSGRGSGSAARSSSARSGGASGSRGAAGGRGGSTGSTGSTRPAGKGGRRPAGTGKGATGRSAAGKKATAARRNAPSPTKDPIVILTRWIVRAVARAWLRQDGLPGWSGHLHAD